MKSEQGKEASFIGYSVPLPRVNFAGGCFVALEMEGSDNSHGQLSLRKLFVYWLNF